MEARQGATMLARVRKALGREIASDRAMRRASAACLYLSYTAFGVGVYVITLIAAPCHRLDVLKELASGADWWLLPLTIVSLLVLLLLLFGRDTVKAYQAAVRLGVLLLAIDVVAAGRSALAFRNELLTMDIPLNLAFLVVHSLGLWTLYGVRPPRSVRLALLTLERGAC